MMGYRAGFQELEIAVPDRYPERHPARTHSLPYLWTADRYPGATLVGVGFRPSRSRAAGAVLLQSQPMAHAWRAAVESLP